MMALLSGIDTHPAHSIALMLRSLGYEVKMLNDDAINALNKRGYPGGVTWGLLNSMGYSRPNIPYVGIEALDTCDLFVDLGATPRKPYLQKMLELYPRLQGKMLHFLINGGKDDYDSLGFEFPVVTSNLWVEGAAFTCYMPFENVHELVPRGKKLKFEEPIGLLHNAYGWGMRYLVDKVVKATGVRIFGSYGSPAGMLTNDKIKTKLENALCFIHLKSNDCPGYALYEALASGVPVVCTELMLDRMKYHELYEDGVTALLWGRKGIDYSEEDAPTGIIRDWFEKNQDSIVEQIVGCVEKLKDPEYNYQIGQAGYERWKKLTEWTDEKRDALREFFVKNSLL